MPNTCGGAHHSWILFEIPELLWVRPAISVQSRTTIGHSILSRHVVAMGGVVDDHIVVDVESLEHGRISHRLHFGPEATGFVGESLGATREDKAARTAKAAIEAAAKAAGRPVPGEEQLNGEAAAAAAAARLLGTHCEKQGLQSGHLGMLCA